MIKNVIEMTYVKIALIICQKVVEFFQLHAIVAVMTGIENVHMTIFLNVDV